MRESSPKRAEQYCQSIAQQNKIDRFLYKAFLKFKDSIRTFLANRYLKGQGIEIGA